jgi:hypothetical protein
MAEDQGSSKTKTVSDGPSARLLVAHFVETARDRNEADPPRRLVGQIATEIAKLIKEGISNDALTAGIELLVEKGQDPSTLPSMVFTAQSRLRGVSLEEQTLLREFLTEHGGRWPTGSSWVHGMAAGTYVQDPLGFDRPNYDVEWGKPTKKQVVAALIERRNDAENGTA